MEADNCRQLWIVIIVGSVWRMWSTHIQWMVRSPVAWRWSQIGSTWMTAARTRSCFSHCLSFFFFSDLIWSFSFSYDTTSPESGCEQISLCREVQICLFPLWPAASVHLIAAQIHCLICRVLELGGGCWCGDTVEKTRGDSCARSDRI